MDPFHVVQWANDALDEAGVPGVAGREEGGARRGAEARRARQAAQGRGDPAGGQGAQGGHGVTTNENGPIGGFYISANKRPAAALPQGRHDVLEPGQRVEATAGAKPRVVPGAGDAQQAGHRRDGASAPLGPHERVPAAYAGPLAK